MFVYNFIQTLVLKCQNKHNFTEIKRFVHHNIRPKMSLDSDQVQKMKI